MFLTRKKIINIIGVSCGIIFFTLFIHSQEQVEIGNISIPEDLRIHARSILGFKSKSSDNKNPDSYGKKPSDMDSAFSQGGNSERKLTVNIKPKKDPKMGDLAPIKQLQIEKKREVLEVKKEIKNSDECSTFLEDQVWRKNRIKSFCEARPEYNATQSYILYMENKNLAYCKHAKVASTTLSSEIIQLLGLMKPEYSINRESNKAIHQLKQNVIYPMLRKTTEFKDWKFKRHLVENSMSFSVVRHPLSRVVSLFKDKILETELNQRSFRDCRMEILKKYGNLSFTSLVQFVLEELKEKCSDEGCQGVNDHFFPQYMKCDYCRMPYKYILKLETFHRDLLCMGKIEKIDFREIQENPTLQKNELSTSELLNSLPKDIYEDLVRMLTPDLEMFGYLPETYRELNSSSPTSE